MKTKKLFAAFAAFALLVSAAAQAEVTNLEFKQYSAQESAQLDLSLLKDSAELDSAEATLLEASALSELDGFRAAPYPAYYTCYAQTPDGTMYSASGYGSADRIQQEALNVCVAQARYNCRRAGCQ